MEGVLGGEYYNVPDVPWSHVLHRRGHAIHGTYWHNNFGTVMSHGCVNLPMDVAEWLYGRRPSARGWKFTTQAFLAQRGERDRQTGRGGRKCTRRPFPFSPRDRESG